MKAASPILRIASRGSPLALAQARLVQRMLATVHGWKPGDIDTLAPILTVKTSGDRIQDRPLAEAGGKGLFVKEIEDALLQDEADIAVHSLKDMPAHQPAGLTLAAVLPREIPHDALISRDHVAFTDLKKGAVLGTSSVRRTAQVLRARPDLSIVMLRGNVETRLKKLESGEADAILLARAGLARLGLTDVITEVLDREDFLPALCQGAIGLEIRQDDEKARGLCGAIDDAPSQIAAQCERGFLAALDGSCRTPIAGWAQVQGTKLSFTGEVLSLDGRNSWASSCGAVLSASPRDDAYRVGERAAADIRDRAGDSLPRF